MWLLVFFLTGLLMNETGQREEIFHYLFLVTGFDRTAVGKQKKDRKNERDWGTDDLISLTELPLDLNSHFYFTSFPATFIKILVKSSHIKIEMYHD